MQADSAAITIQAIDWHLRQAEMSEGEWEAFVVWLEASPAHAAAYDRIALEDRLIGTATLAPEAANDSAPPMRGWRWIGGGVAVAAVAALVAPWMMPVKPTGYEIATKVGERRIVQLADGTSIEMNGGTRLRLDHASPRVAELEQGEATLHVEHDAANPFIVTSGGLTVRDAGTTFNLARANGKVSVEVSEGSVLFEPESAALRLTAGDALVVREQDRQVTRFKVAPDLVGGWRTGQLSFDGETLAVVADAIHRRYGTNLELEGSLPQRPFTGMVRLSGVADRDIPHLATMIGTTWRRDGKRWILADQPAPR